MFDEVEEWNLIQAHYCIAWGVNQRGEGEGGGNSEEEEEAANASRGGGAGAGLFSAMIL